MFTPSFLSFEHLALAGDDLLPTEPIFGTDSVQWSVVFGKIQQTECLWDVWKPSGSLDEKLLKEIWDCYNIGEAVFDETSNQTGMKPPLWLVEQHFQARWRQTSTVKLLFNLCKHEIF